MVFPSLPSLRGGGFLFLTDGGLFPSFWPNMTWVYPQLMGETELWTQETQYTLVSRWIVPSPTKKRGVYELLWYPQISDAILHKSLFQLLVSLNPNSVLRVCTPTRNWLALHTCQRMDLEQMFTHIDSLHLASNLITRRPVIRAEMRARNYHEQKKPKSASFFVFLAVTTHWHETYYDRLERNWWSFC